MIGVRAVGPLVGVRPKTDLALQSVCLRFSRDELERLEILISLGIGQRHGAYFVAGDLEQIRVRKVEIISRNTSREVIADSKVQAKPINPACGKLAEVTPPKLFVVVPAFIF